MTAATVITGADGDSILSPIDSIDSSKCNESLKDPNESKDSNESDPNRPSCALRRQQRKQERKAVKRMQKFNSRLDKHVDMLEEAVYLKSLVESNKLIDFSSSGLIPQEKELYRNLPRRCIKIGDYDTKVPESNDSNSNMSQSLTPVKLLDLILNRPLAYQSKYAAQELSLLLQIWGIQEKLKVNQPNKSFDSVLDVGAGNANLSLLISILFDVPVAVVEMESPRAELRAEELVHEGLKRMKVRIGDRKDDMKESNNEQNDQQQESDSESVLQSDNLSVAESEFLEIPRIIRIQDLMIQEFDFEKHLLSKTANQLLESMNVKRKADFQKAEDCISTMDTDGRKSSSFDVKCDTIKEDEEYEIDCDETITKDTQIQQNQENKFDDQEQSSKLSNSYSNPIQNHPLSSLPNNLNIFKRTLVVGKHLCGPGTDGAIRFCGENDTNSNRIVACLFATCCCNKIVGKEFFGYYGGMVTQGILNSNKNDISDVDMIVNDNLGSDVKASESNVNDNVNDGQQLQQTEGQSQTQQIESQQSQSELHRQKLQQKRIDISAVSQDPAIILASKISRERKRRKAEVDKIQGSMSMSSPSSSPGVKSESDSATTIGIAKNNSIDSLNSNENLNLNPGISLSSSPTTSPSEESENLITRLAKTTSWRNTSKSENSLITDQMLLHAEYFESFIQKFRKKRLAEIFGGRQAVQEVLYCDTGPHSQQNRCLIAVRNQCDRGNNTAEENFNDYDDDLVCKPVNDIDSESPNPLNSGNSDSESLSKLESSFLSHFQKVAESYKEFLPVDLRPRGLISAKFAYNGISMEDKGSDLLENQGTNKGNMDDDNESAQGVMNWVLKGNPRQPKKK